MSEDDMYSDFLRESTLDTSRYSESLNALIGQANTSWSPNSIKCCESCNKEFTFRRRRHHCRKCGCLVCHKCSKQQLVLPRVSSAPLRVCDSCFLQVHCNPVEDLAIATAEDVMAKDVLSQILYISIISKTDTLMQAIIQGFSTALSGTPLGLEVDVRKFPPRLWGVRFASSPPVLDSPVHRRGRPRADTPVVMASNGACGHSWPDEEPQEEESDNANTQQCEQDLNQQQVPTSPERGLLVEQHVTECASPHHVSSVNPSPVSSRMLDISHYSAFALRRAKNNAKSSHDMFLAEHSVSPDYGIGIEMAFCTINGAESKKLKTHRRVQRQHALREGLTFSSSWQHAYLSGDDELDGSSVATDSEDGDESLDDVSDVETSSYYLFYWICIWDGVDLRSGRSSQVLLPPSVCELLESDELHDKIVRTEVTTPPACSQECATECNAHVSPQPPGPHTHFIHNYRDVDPEQVLIALLSRKEQDHLLSSCSMSQVSHVRALRSTLHNLPSSPLSHTLSPPSSGSCTRTSSVLPDTTLLTPAAGLIGWLSGGKVNRNKFLEASIHMTMLPFLLMRNVYDKTAHLSPERQKI